MYIIKNDFMEVTYEVAQNVFTVKWSDALSVESPLFYQTIISLFAIIQERKVRNLIIDSGIPAGGVLTEEVINYFIQHIPYTTLRNIALLESPDFLWDNNLYQVLSLLITSYHLPIAIEMVKSPEAGREWFAQAALASPHTDIVG
ncbi:hypothetical protein [Pontibacter chitinilyticus]|uniref:hypothetical protein n=1 Tax=Pontibacter chitinilyticus TaxID=2674989 RepID=UPI00321A1744